MGKNIEAIAIGFIRSLERGVSAEELFIFYHQCIGQIEFPNAVTKFTAVRNFNDLKTAFERGKKILQEENYEIINSYSFENTVIIEAVWTAVVAVQVGNIPAGGAMRAHFAQFYEFKDDKIIRQRNYDCFDSFG